MDDFTNDLGNLYSVIYLMGSTHEDSLIRNTAIEKRTEIGKYFNEIQLNENLYLAVSTYSQSEEAKGLTGYKKRFLKQTLAKYERSGFALSKEKRNELKILMDEIAEIGNEFNTNVSKY